MKSIIESAGVATRTSDLTLSPLTEGDADRVAALASAPALGECLIRLKAGGCPGARSRAVILLAHALRDLSAARKWKLPSGSGANILFRLAARAIWEYEHETCSHCFGRGRVARDGSGKSIRHPGRNAAWSVCTDCGGTGARRASGRARATALGVSERAYARHWELRCRKALWIIYDAEAIAAKEIARRLGRRSGY